MVMAVNSKVDKLKSCIYELEYWAQLVRVSNLLTTILTTINKTTSFDRSSFFKKVNRFVISSEIRHKNVGKCLKSSLGCLLKTLIIKVVQYSRSCRRAEGTLRNSRLNKANETAAIRKWSDHHRNWSTVNRKSPCSTRLSCTDSLSSCSGNCCHLALSSMDEVHDLAAMDRESWSWSVRSRLPRYLLIPPPRSLATLPLSN